MIYAMSDIHGEYAKYRAMLEKIHFTDDDTLFVIGDVVDRGPEPVKLLQDMAARANVCLIKGNHDALAAHMLRMLNVEITMENAETHIDADFMGALMDWQRSGGDATMVDFHRLSADERADLLDYLEDAPLYETVDAGENSFILVHSGLGNFDPSRRLSDYSFDELACMRADYSRRYFDDPSIFVVSGHTPTLAVTGNAEIHRANNNILIDCGAAYGGRLACICLDTMEAYYI